MSKSYNRYELSLNPKDHYEILINHLLSRRIIKNESELDKLLEERKIYKHKRTDESLNNFKRQLKNPPFRKVLIEKLFLEFSIDRAKFTYNASIPKNLNERYYFTGII